MSSPPKPLDTLQEPWVDSSVDKQRLSPPANPSSRPDQPLTPHESTSPALPKSQADDAETSSSLSAAPSPLTTHRPTSSKTSIDDQPLTPLDSPEKASQSAKDPPESIQEAPKEPEQDAEVKAEAEPLKQPSPTLIEKPVEKPLETPKVVLPENKVDAILQLNAQLLNVYNEFHTQGQVSVLHNELQQYSVRIQSNVQWLVQYKETLGTQFASRIPLQIASPPPPVPFTSTESINALYAHLSSLFEKENARAQRKQQLRQMMLAGSGGTMTGASASSPINVNANGKRERTEDDHPSSERTGDHSPRKRVDTGESKTTPGMPNTNTPSPASMHASPSRMNASPSYINASTNPNPAPGAPGGPLRPTSSQSNSSSHANTAQAPMAPPPTFPGGAGGGVNGGQGMMAPQQQLERMRMMQQQQNRIRAMGGGPGNNDSPQNMMNGGGAPQQQNQHPPTQQGQNQNVNPSIAAQISGLGIAPRPVPPAILPQLMAMIQNPQMHQSVQLLQSKIPGFRTMPGEQQAGVLWAFQQNQMRQQQEMQQRQIQQQHQMQQMQQNMQAQGGQMQGQMPGQMQGQGQMQQQVMQNGYPQNAAMGMGGMRPNSAGSMQPPPSPHSIQQRQLNLMQQQQQAAMGRAAPLGMSGGYPGGAMNPGGGMGMGGMNMGGHARMPSNPTMGPPPVPGSVPTSQSMYPQGMNQYPPGAVNPMNLSYSMQPQQQQQQQQHYGMHHQSPSMAGSPPNSASSTAWSPMSGGGGGQPLTPAAIMQQHAKMSGMSPAPGPGGGGGSIDPNSIVNWQDLAT